MGKKKVLILNGHPDKGSFCEALAEKYKEGALAKGHEAKMVRIDDLDFDLILRKGFHQPGDPLEEGVLEQQELIKWCDHLVIVVPNWFWNMTASLKGYVDRVFLTGFSSNFSPKFPYVIPLLKGRSARVIGTQNASKFIASVIKRDLFWQNIKGSVLKPCGFAPIKRTTLTPIVSSSPEQREQWLDEIFELGRQAK